jgi:riboflavin-specific deaminase-like protein
MVDARPGASDSSARCDGDLQDASFWDTIPGAFRRGSPLPQPWQDIFGPLREGTVDDLVIVGQCGQSIDARIATSSGDSHYINGEAGLDHLHRLRALVDAVIVGVGTAVADDPRLTVRRMSGPNPARVVIDPNGRLPASARALAADGTRRLVVTSEAIRTRFPADVEVVPLASENGRIAPAAVVRALAERGLRRILVEGGSETLSRFLAARCLDRLHVLVAPIILGSGRMSLSLPPLARIGDAVRLPMRTHVLIKESCGPSMGIGPDLLLDCDLSAQRMEIGRAKMSR